jgi:superfamily I DNA and/or RNA helicase
MTTSDPNHLTAGFLNSPHRLNLAMTRARTKLIVIGSRAFFYAIPDSENMLEKNNYFKVLLRCCEEQKTVFSFSSSH